MYERRVPSQSSVPMSQEILRPHRRLLAGCLPQPSHPVLPKEKPLSIRSSTKRRGNSRTHVLPVNSHLHLEVNAMTRTVTVKVINDQSGEVIRQIPSEELMGLAVAMENGEGVLVNRRI